ncbi:MAG: PTS sugar transporter subunit IIA [Spirochaetia bacterium]|nr:PTS sugar transporter subunit IIA [Spirochaetia bacterium]
MIHNLNASTKEEALTIMAERLYELGYVKQTFKEAILDREAHYPSGLPMEGEKIAIPHTDAEHVTQSVICFAQLTQPVEFSVMGDPSQSVSVQMISMFALKEKKEIGHLLEVLITTYQDAALLKELKASNDVEHLYRLLEEHIGRRLEGTR